MSAEASCLLAVMVRLKRWPKNFRSSSVERNRNSVQESTSSTQPTKKPSAGRVSLPSRGTSASRTQGTTLPSQVTDSRRIHPAKTERTRGESTTRFQPFASLRPFRYSWAALSAALSLALHFPSVILLWKAGRLLIAPALNRSGSFRGCSWLVLWSCSGSCRVGPNLSWRQEH